MPDTKAGQALLEAYRDLDDPMRQKVNFANGIAAIEREAAQQPTRLLRELLNNLWRYSLEYPYMTDGNPSIEDEARAWIDSLAGAPSDD